MKTTGSRFPSSLCNGVSWLVFLIATSIYWITADRYVSFWDCPEYVATASLLEVGHPPGNPFWTLSMHVVTLPFPPYLHAFVINLCSGLFMSFSALFLARIIFFFSYKLLTNFHSSRIFQNVTMAFVSAGGALTFAFCDSAWFSATESEVYAMSAFITSLSLWLMLVWYKTYDRRKRCRLLVLTAYLTGLSLGVHQLNLLMIPVFFIIWLYRKYPGRVIAPVFLALFFTSFLTIGVILMGIIPGSIWFAGAFELATVNFLNMPYNSGVVGAIIVITIIAAIALFLSRNLKYIHLSLWMLTALLVGFSSYALIMIRSVGAPPLNEASPDNIYAFQSYLARDQYGSTPLLYGRTPYSMPLLAEEWSEDSEMPRYSRYVLKKGKRNFLPVLPESRVFHRSMMADGFDSLQNQKILENNHGYVLADYSFSHVTTPELDMWFPRMTSPSDIDSYRDWTGMNHENMTKVDVSETIDSLGHFAGRMTSPGVRNQATSYRPTYGQNLQFFISYQLYYMYLRYLLWNFAGRQNDYHSTGEIDHGNFITGFDAIDTKMVGDQSLMPLYAGAENPGRNVYYCIPFLLGIIGIISLCFRGWMGRRILMIVALFFFMTGIAIIIYLNQGPGEPRERDYSFIGSYMAFSIWIAMGVLGLVRLAARWLKPGFLTAFIIVPLSLLSPALLLAENFDDHDRRNRHTVDDFSSSILDMSAPAIVLSQGDNYSFPLWYAQETLSKGKNHSVIDLNYLMQSSYVVNLMKQGNKGISITAAPGDIAYGAYSLVAIEENQPDSSVSLKEALISLYSQKEGRPRWRHPLVYVTSKDKNDTVWLNINDFTEGKRFIPFRQLMILDILASNQEMENSRPILVLNSVGSKISNGLKPLLTQGINGKWFAPEFTDSAGARLIAEELDMFLSDTPRIFPNYADPVILERMRKDRGHLVALASDLEKYGYHQDAAAIVSYILENFPYDKIPEGAFYFNDSTYYEGIEFVRLLLDLYASTHITEYYVLANTHLNSFEKNSLQWNAYINSLPPSRRKTVSNSSLLSASSLKHIKVLREELDSVNQTLSSLP